MNAPEEMRTRAQSAEGSAQDSGREQGVDSQRGLAEQAVPGVDGHLREIHDEENHAPVATNSSLVSFFVNKYRLMAGPAALATVVENPATIP